jgi:heptosyltransferase-2
MGAPSDKKDSDAVKTLSPKSSNLTGKMSLYDSTMALRDFDLVICNDSAPSHMAASLQRPVLCVFGPTVLDFGFRPWNDKSQVVENETLTCRPCGPHGHVKCPLSHHDCMNKIEIKNAYSAAVKILTQEKI